MARKSSPPIARAVSAEDVDPRHRWDRPLQAPGHTQVDFEERVDFKRLHAYRLGRARQALAKSGLGAVLVFDQYNIRYLSGTVIGEWARDKLTRWCLLTGTGEPWVWDFGSAARHHRLYAPQIAERQSLAGMVGMRGAVSPKAGLFKKAAQEIRDILKAEGVAGMPLGIDLVEPPFLFALQELGVEIRDGQQVMLEARMLKSQDELTLLNMAAAMVDGVYQDIFEALKPGARENEIVALANKRLHERPIISRLNSFDDPMELQAGMMFAVETYCPATDGTSAARIEEEVIVTPGGAQIITLFPADELPIANKY